MSGRAIETLMWSRTSLFCSQTDTPTATLKAESLKCGNSIYLEPKVEAMMLRLKCLIDLYLVVRRVKAKIDTTLCPSVD